MTVVARHPLVLSLSEAAERHADLEGFAWDGGSATVALPPSYVTKPKRRYPLLILVGGDAILGSAIEMSRLMGGTGEIRETILVAVPVDPDDRMLAALGARYRVSDEPPIVFRPSGDADLAVAGLVGSLRERLSTGKPYAREAPVFRFRPLMSALVALRPVFGRLARRRRRPLGEPSRFLVRAEALDREFEVFAILPAGADAAPADRRYPALVVLDASIELSIVAETAARLAAAGTIPELLVIGIGVPRREGTQAAGFRRFEEFSPPQDAAAWRTDLGRVFRSLFAVVGRDARIGVDRAPDLRRFIVDELLPRLQRELPIDPGDLGLLGHSAGATFVGYALQTAAPFRRFIAISPGIAMSGSWLSRTVADRAPLPAPERDVWLTFGGGERENHFNRIAGIPETPHYADALRARGDLQLRSGMLDGETHSSVFPRAVVHALREVYGAGRSS